MTEGCGITEDRPLCLPVQATADRYSPLRGESKGGNLWLIILFLHQNN